MELYDTDIKLNLTHVGSCISSCPKKAGRIPRALACSVHIISSCCCLSTVCLLSYSHPPTPLPPSMDTPLSSDSTMTSSRVETHLNHPACACPVTPSTITHSGSHGTRLLSIENEYVGRRARLSTRGHGKRRGQEPGVRVKLEPRRQGGGYLSPAERGTLPTTSAFAGLIVAAVVTAVSCFPGAWAMSVGADHSCAVITDGRVKVSASSAERVCVRGFRTLLFKMCFLAFLFLVDHGYWTNQMDECKVLGV